MTHTAIVGGGIAGITAAWQLHQLGRPFTLYEASARLGGPIETVHREGFLIELGPDGWITEKPWAAELARELGLGAELIVSNDATRVTWLVAGGKLVAIPDGMRMTVPTDLHALQNTPLFSPQALAAYAAEPGRAAELIAGAPEADESIASFIGRHFGPEVLHKLAAPLLSGVFGGNVDTLSVRAVMPQFVQMERDHGSLILALQRAAAARAGRLPQPIFTSLRSGVQTLIDRLAAALPPDCTRFDTPIQQIGIDGSDGSGWLLTGPDGTSRCDHLVLATPSDVTRGLLQSIAPPHLLPTESSSAILVAFAFSQSLQLPQGFGFLAPRGEAAILAATFSDQKYPHRAPAGQHLLRAFFGGASESPHDPRSDAELTTLALAELRRILHNSGFTLPEPSFSLVRRWPRSLPQYAVGHVDRTDQLLAAMPPNLHLLGNPYRGVGLPDLIRDARATARAIAS